jgi:hypothetical protein
MFTENSTAALEMISARRTTARNEGDDGRVGVLEVSVEQIEQQSNSRIGQSGIPDAPPVTITTFPSIWPITFLPILPVNFPHHQTGARA